MLRGVNVATMGAGSTLVVGNWEVEVEEAADGDKFKWVLLRLLRAVRACKAQTQGLFISAGCCMRVLGACCQLVCVPEPTPSPFCQCLLPFPACFCCPAPLRSGELFLKPTAAAVLAAAPVAAFHKPAAGGVGGGFKRPGMAGSGASSAAAAAAAAAAAKPEPARWLHDPHADNALVLNAQQWAGGSGTLSRGALVCPVVVDSYLARHLRPHQVLARAAARCCSFCDACCTPSPS